MQNKKILLTLIFTAACFAATLYAQAPPGGGPGTSGPVDGGVVALVAGAAAYGYKKIRENRKKGL